MAVISITAANVLASALATIEKNFLAGATITAGQAVYLDPATTTWKLIDTDVVVSNLALDTLRGIALGGASSGQPVSVATRDPDFKPGGTLVNGGAVHASVTAGGLDQTAPGSGSYPVVMGIAKSTSKMNLNPTASGAVI